MKLKTKFSNTGRNIHWRPFSKKHIKILYFNVDTRQECFSFKIIDIKRNRDCIVGFNRINEDIIASNIYERKIIANKLLFNTWHQYARYIMYGSIY